MNKKLALISILLAGILAGCSLIPQFQQAREQYLETRVAELLEQTPAIETEVATGAVVTEAVAEVTATTEEVVEETVEPTIEATAEVTEEPKTVETSEPTLTPMVTSYDPAVYLGDATWKDEMTEVGNWPTSTDDYMSVSYENGALKITALSETNGWRIASTESLENAYIEATVKMGTCTETDGYGIIFRVPEDTGYNRGYLFGITCDGRYSLRTWDGLTGENGLMKSLKVLTISDLINKGKDQTNRLGIMAIGNRLIMYINGEKVDEVSDDAYSEGFFGIYINRDNTENLTIHVNEVKYWVDPTAK